MLGVIKQCRVLFIFMLNAVILSVVMLNVVAPLPLPLNGTARFHKLHLLT